MDVLFFLAERTKFIRRFYDEAVLPFIERKRQIKAGEGPWVAPYSEDGEPPFLEEWMEAEESIDVLGQMCISLLSSSLQLYLSEAVTQLLRRYDSESLARAGIGRPESKKAAFKEGWINGYRAYFREDLAIDWSDAASDLNVLEEIVLARNRAQHPEEITSLQIKQSRRDAERYPRSFFADELELKMFAGGETQGEWVRPWRLNVTRDRLFASVEEVDRLCSWLDDELRKWPSQLERRAAAEQ